MNITPSLEGVATLNLLKMLQDISSEPVSLFRNDVVEVLPRLIRNCLFKEVLDRDELDALLDISELILRNPIESYLLALSYGTLESITFAIKKYITIRNDDGYDVEQLIAGFIEAASKLSSVTLDLTIKAVNSICGKGLIAYYFAWQIQFPMCVFEKLYEYTDYDTERATLESYYGTNLTDGELRMAFRMLDSFHNDTKKRA